jgi:hypothetical protein
MPNSVEEVVSTDIQLEDIKAGIHAFFNPQQLVEVRTMGTNGYWHGFYFDNHERMAEVIKQLDHDPRIQSVYYVFNEINPKLDVARNPTADEVEKILTGPSQRLTSNEDIIKRRWLFIDVDTIRAVGHEHDSSTREEKAACREVFTRIQEYLESRGWPIPLVADSGNGYHIFIKINMDNTAVNTAYIEDCLKALAVKFTCASASIDPQIFNASRITRAYGTHTRKGLETAERPYRRNKIKRAEKIGLVTFDQITALADEGPKTNKVNRGNMPLLHDSFDPGDFFEWFEDQGAFEITNTKDWHGHTVHVVDRCIISETKHTGSVLTGFIVGDSFGYHCWSPECGNPNIGDVLRKLNDDGYKRYPKDIWTEEPILLDFDAMYSGEFENALQEKTEQYKSPTQREEVFETKEDTEKSYPPSITDVLEERLAQDRAEEAAEIAADNGVEPPPPPPPVKEKPIRIGDIVPNQYAEWLMSVIFRDPKKANTDYSFFKKRLQKVSRHLADAVREAFGAMVLFERSNKYLPSKEELIDYLNNSEDCLTTPLKDEAVTLIRTIEDDGTHFFDTTAKRLISEMDWSLENDTVREAFKKQLHGKRDIEAFRTALRKHWATSIGFNSDYRPGTWQENADLVYESFRRDLSGEDDSRKFRTGFPSIDDSGMNIGLDGNHAIAVYGPASNRKTNFVMSMALNFAMDGKRGLLLVGEHQRLKIEKRLTLMLSYYLRKDEKNPDGLVPVIPGLRAWESRNVTATQDDLANIGIVLAELKAMRIVPGYLEVQNINSLTRGEEDPIGAIMEYIDSSHKKYDWDYVIIDPLDTVLPVNMGDRNEQMSGSFSVIDRLFDYSRSFAGDKGLMLIVTAQFKSDVRREIEKIQAKNGGMDDYDDEIVSILRQDSGIQYIGNKLTQRFDLAIGVALRVKDGFDGMLVKGRSREDNGTFDVVYVNIDPDSNLMLESAGTITRKVAADTNGAPVHEDHSPYDAL